MQRWELYPGMLVTHKNNKIGGEHLARVMKVNPKNVLIQYESGQRWNEPMPELRLSAAPEGAVFNIDEAEDLELGDPVRFVDGSQGEQVFAVIGIQGGGLYKLARIRGSKNRYFHRVAANQLVLVPEGEVQV